MPNGATIEVIFADRELWIGSMWKATKALYLKRDPRFALHSGRTTLPTGAVTPSSPVASRRPMTRRSAGSSASRPPARISSARPTPPPPVSDSPADSNRASRCLAPRGDSDVDYNVAGTPRPSCLPPRLIPPRHCMSPHRRLSASRLRVLAVASPPRNHRDSPAGVIPQRNRTRELLSSQPNENAWQRAWRKLRLLREEAR